MSAERRTRAQKEKTTTHRLEQHTYSFSSGTRSTVSKTEKASSKAARDVSDLFSYDSSLIYRDLSKTVVIASIVLATLLGIRFFLS
jgi:hypothetical protein